MIFIYFDIAFLEWRRALADKEEKAFGEKEITPFEKNIEIWRQLYDQCFVFFHDAICYLMI
jgi:hypothetical protein